MTDQKPPVCNYEGSDYQTRFWENGDRAYEDAAEAVALKRMLPASGELMLELGAGAGRNTPRYQGYKRIVLLDYSRTQLEQARQRLGKSGRYIYVAADIYRLPFVDGLFDGSTMIRTLHHMADAPLALQQVERVMQTGGTFILEYASKQNLKAIARWLLGVQKWSPFSPEPVEFASLNFDFHPATVHRWLSQTGFSIERILTVSHLRSLFFKKILPLGWMVNMDALFSLTGNWWQLTPSVFVKTTAPRSKPEPQGFFQCPACGSRTLTEAGESVICNECHHIFSYSGGIYDFRLDV
jgi:ubiquinone/menaquinone biosynthesis C-methylase UbiE